MFPFDDVIMIFVSVLILCSLCISELGTHIRDGGATFGQPGSCIRTSETNLNPIDLYELSMKQTTSKNVHDSGHVWSRYQMFDISKILLRLASHRLHNYIPLLETNRVVDSQEKKHFDVYILLYIYIYFRHTTTKYSETSSTAKDLENNFSVKLFAMSVISSAFPAIQLRL